MGYSKEVLEFHRYCPGVPEAKEWQGIVEKYMKYMDKIEKDPTKHSTGPNRLLVDLVWVVCLYKADIISLEDTKKLLQGILDVQQGKAKLIETKSHGYAERNLINALDNDEDLASMVNLGRTLQEPMSRLDLRDMLIDTFEDLLDLMSTVTEIAKANVETVMPGHTHMSQAQPITLASYLLSVFDPLYRGYIQLELAYKDTNLNSGGCGATSGITWPVDRYLMAELLGLDGLVEPAYDAEASQDHSLSILFALSNIVLLISKTSMDMNIWSMEEMEMLKVDPAWCGVSSMMPNKCIPGSLFERARIEAGYVVGQMMQASVLVKGEPHGDMLPMLEPPKIAWHAMAHTMSAMAYLKGMLKNIIPQKETMKEYVRRGFSCSSEVSYYMVKEHGYGPRRAHRIVATMVRMARERNLKAYEVTGELLEEAAAFAEERQPHIDTDTIRNLLDPENFIKTHTNAGGTAPSVVKKMIEKREKELTDCKSRQEDRKKNIEQGNEKLQNEINAILKK